MSPRNRLLRPGKWRGKVQRKDHALRVLLGGIHGPKRMELMMVYLKDPSRMWEAYSGRIRTHMRFARG